MLNVKPTLPVRYCSPRVVLSLPLLGQLNSPDPAQLATGLKILGLQYGNRVGEVVGWNVLAKGALIGICVSLPAGANQALSQLEARDISLTPADLDFLAGSRHEKVQNFVLEHRLTPPEAIWRMAQNDKAIAGVAFETLCHRHTAFVTERLDEIMAKADDSVIAVALTIFGGELGRDNLLKIGTGRDGPVALTAIETLEESQQLVPDDFIKLAAADSLDVRFFVAGHSMADENLLLAMAMETGPEAVRALEQLARRNRLIPNILARFASSRNEKVVQAVAENGRTPLRTLVRLAASEVFGPRALGTIVQKKKVTPKVLDRMAGSRCYEVLKYIIAHSQSPPRTLARLGREGFISAEVALLDRGLKLEDFPFSAVRRPDSLLNRENASGRQVFETLLRILRRPETPDKIRLDFLRGTALDKYSGRWLFSLIFDWRWRLRQTAFAGLDYANSVPFEELQSLAPDAAAYQKAIAGLLKKNDLSSATLKKIAGGRVLAVEAFNLLGQRGLLNDRAFLDELKTLALDDNVRIRATRLSARIQALKEKPPTEPAAAAESTQPQE